MSLFNSNVSTAQLSFLPIPQPAVTFEGQLATNLSIHPPKAEAQNFTLYQPEADILMEDAVEADLVPAMEESVSITTEKVKGTYSIIVGSFLDDRRMNREITALQSKGFVVKTMAGPNGYTRVAIQFAEAPISSKLSKLQEVRNTINADAWILGI